MKFKLFIAILTLFSFLSVSANCQNKNTKTACTGNDECCKKQVVKTTSKNKSVNMISVKKDKEVACQLTSPELQKRKAEVIALLKENILERKEITNGYQYTFKGSDKMVDDLISFIKVERACCGFFTFKLSIEDEESNLVLSITGPKGAKEFIDTEIEL